MSSMPWIKLYTEILDDPKLGRLSDATAWRFVQLCLLAGECDAEGYLVNGDEPLQEDDIAWRLRIDKDQLLKDLTKLGQVGLVEFEQGEFNAWCVINFAKRQGRSQSEKREAWRERKQRQRDKDSGNHDGHTKDVTRDNDRNHAGITALEQSRVEQSRVEKEGEAEADCAANDAAPVASPHSRNPTAISQKLAERGIDEPKRSQLVGKPWITEALIDDWWAYISSWPKATKDVKLSSLVSRLEAQRLPPPEYRNSMR